MPYGDEITSTGNDREKFATYTRDSFTGLDYADQRFYASTYGRFNTPDPSGGSINPGNPQSWNRYSYTLGDPVNGNDPSGLDSNFCLSGTGLIACAGADSDTASSPASATGSAPSSNFCLSDTGLIACAGANGVGSDATSAPASSGNDPTAGPGRTSTERSDAAPAPSPPKQPAPPSLPPSSCSVYPPNSILQTVCSNAGNNGWANVVRACLQSFYIPGVGYVPFNPFLPPFSNIPVPLWGFVDDHGYCFVSGLLNLL
jgi:RHS repeat-associated protein